MSPWLAAVALLASVSLERDRPITARLAGGEQHEYAVRLRAGTFAHVTVEQQGVDVVVTALGPDGKSLAEVDSPNGANGPEPLGFAASGTGTHRVVVRSFDERAAAGSYTIRLDELLSPSAYRARLAEIRRTEAAVTAWMRSRAVPLRSAAASAADLTPLRDVFRDVRIVGLGEATHGTHEIFTLKNRLIEFLVTQLGFRMIAFEGTAAGAEAINAYIQGGGDRAAVKAALNTIWITQTAELEALIEWLRASNTRVTFVGVDPQGNAPADATLRAFLRATDPAMEESVRPVLDFLRAEDEKANRFERTSVPAERVLALERLIAFLVTREGDLVRRTSSREYAAALNAARLMAQSAYFNSDGALTRDAAMAENFFRAMQRMPDARAIVWAHNAHISASDRSSYRPLGTLLRNAYGTGYYAIATSFSRGSFRAQVPRSSPPDLRTFTVPAAPAGTIDAILAAMQLPLAFVDLRGTPPPTVAAWLAEPRRMHWIGALWADTFTEAQAFQPYIVNRDFDGVVFIENTTANQ